MVPTMEKKDGDNNIEVLKLQDEFLKLVNYSINILKEDYHNSYINF